jgi:hypothetical protein
LVEVVLAKRGLPDRRALILEADLFILQVEHVAALFGARILGG